MLRRRPAQSRLRRARHQSDLGKSIKGPRGAHASAVSRMLTHAPAVSRTDASPSSRACSHSSRAAPAAEQNQQQWTTDSAHGLWHAVQGSSPHRPQVPAGGAALETTAVQGTSPLRPQAATSDAARCRQQAVQGSSPRRPQARRDHPQTRTGGEDEDLGTSLKGPFLAHASAVSRGSPGCPTPPARQQQLGHAPSAGGVLAAVGPRWDVGRHHAAGQRLGHGRAGATPAAADGSKTSKACAVPRCPAPRFPIPTEESSVGIEYYPVWDAAAPPRPVPHRQTQTNQALLTG